MIFLIITWNYLKNQIAKRSNSILPAAPFANSQEMIKLNTTTQRRKYPDDIFVWNIKSEFMSKNEDHLSIHSNFDFNDKNIE